MKIFLYLSKDYSYNGRIEQVLTHLNTAKFYFSQYDSRIFSLVNELNLRAEYVNENYLAELSYILIFYNKKDKTAVRLARHAAEKSKTLILVPGEVII